VSVQLPCPPSSCTDLVCGLGVEGLNLQTTTDVAHAMGGELGCVVRSESADTSDGNRMTDGGEKLGAEHAGGDVGANLSRIDRQRMSKELRWLYLLQTHSFIHPQEHEAQFADSRRLSHAPADRSREGLIRMSNWCSA
jgi:hypothetical protein